MAKLNNDIAQTVVCAHVKLAKHNVKILLRIEEKLFLFSG